MATNWITLTGKDVRQVLTTIGQEEGNENLADTTRPGDPLEMSATNRRDQAVTAAVAEVRGVIQSAGRHPLSVTTGTVPPDAQWHTLVLAAWRLVNSTPGLARSFLAGEGGAETPLAKMHREAREWLWGKGTPAVGGLAQGANAVTPNDPTGADYLTAANDDITSASYNPSISGIYWGSTDGTSYDYARGYSIDPVSGAEIPLPVNMRI